VSLVNLVRPSLSTLAIVCSAAALLGCSSDGNVAGADASADGSMPIDGGPGDATPVEATPDAAPQEASVHVEAGAGVAFCDATYGELRITFEGCCNSSDTSQNDYKFIDAIYAAITTDCENAVSSAIAKGRVAFDTTAAAACEAAFQQRVDQGNCWGVIDTNQPGPPIFGSSACQGVVAGLQAAGQPCAVDFECQNGLSCVGWTGATDGTCTAPGSVGAACEQAPDAGSALYLDWGFGNHPSCAAGAYCVTPTCQAQGASGAPCTSDAACAAQMTCLLGACSASGPSGDGGPCDGKVDCQDGFYCAPADGGATGACTPREPLGGGCSANGDQCKGLCVVPDGGTSGVCTAFCGSG